ncbi:MAG: ATP-binding protein [marine benthic group bacterium]|nr:ATP-binding protein [Gemmatimonadota bacterium]MCL7979769.1 ATP-binding protein [Gemmatimonadota bacterium]
MSTRRTFVLLLLALTIPFGLFLLWTALELKPQLLEREIRQLSRTAYLVGEDLAQQPFSDSIADLLGEVAGVRVTLIDRDGNVLGDSEVEASRLPTIENHADRPEVAAALEGREGSDLRASGTIALRLLYVAVPHSRGVVRLAQPESETTAFLGRTRQVAAATALLAFVLAMLLAGMVHRLRTTPLEKLRTALDRIGEGDLSTRIGGQGGGAAGALGHSIDEMALRLGERVEKLESERSELSTVFDRLDDGLAVIDREGQIQRVNRAFETWVGRSELSGQRLASLFRDPENRVAVDSALQGTAANHETDLGNRTVLLSALPLKSGALVVIRDLTRTRQLEGVRRDFVANVSHELKTPLTSMRGFAEALADSGVDPDTTRDFAGRILANTDRMQHLVDDLLDLARIESGAWRPEIEELRVRPLIDDAWASLQSGAERRGIRLEPDLPEDLKVRADREALFQVLSNLLDNAVRYAPDASPIRLTARPDDFGVRFEVADEGPGIPSAQLERVFERFYRVDAARSREAGGTGLGLSIVKHLVAAHGGEVGIDSALGEGTRAWFVIPGSHPTS